MLLLQEKITLFRIVNSIVAIDRYSNLKSIHKFHALLSRLKCIKYNKEKSFREKS